MLLLYDYTIEVENYVTDETKIEKTIYYVVSTIEIPFKAIFDKPCWDCFFLYIYIFLLFFDF